MRHWGEDNYKELEELGGDRNRGTKNIRKGSGNRGRGMKPICILVMGSF